MLEIHNFHGYEVGISEDRYPFLRQLFNRAGLLVQFQETQLYSPSSITEEESGIRQQEVALTSCFQRTREKVRQALQAIGSYVFSKFNLPRQTGLDIGSGATGYMVENLLAPEISENKAFWVQSDVNPTAVRENQKQHPSSTIVEASYHNADGLGLNGNLDIVTGLSCLDATQFVPEAIESIRKMLKQGGFFLHIQDVRPGNATGTRVLNRKGIPPPHQFEALMVNGQPQKLAYSIGPDQEVVSVIELFREDLAHAIGNNSGFEILLNDWVTARKIANQPNEQKIYYANMCISNPDPSLEASALVTVARKIR